MMKKRLTTQGQIHRKSGQVRKHATLAARFCCSNRAVKTRLIQIPIQTFGRDEKTQAAWFTFPFFLDVINLHKINDSFRLQSRRSHSYKNSVRLCVGLFCPLITCSFLRPARIQACLNYSLSIPLYNLFFESPLKLYNLKSCATQTDGWSVIELANCRC